MCLPPPRSRPCTAKPKKKDRDMGVYPSKTELFLPSETLLRCSPERCWCKGGHHRDSRYVYVEHGGDGRERYHDGFDMMSQLMGNGGGAGAGAGMWPAWKDPSQWSIRDMERFTDFFAEWQNREMGRKARLYGMGGGGGGGYGYGEGGPGIGRGEFDRMQADMEERFKRMTDEYARNNEERDAFLFGSGRERRKDQFQSNILRMIQDMWPQLTQMAGGGGGGGGFGTQGMGPMGMPMGMGPMGMNMPSIMPQGGGMGAPMGWPPATCGTNMFNTPPGMPQMPPGMMPQMPMHNMMDPNVPGRHPYRRRRNFAMDDEFDEDLNFANPYRNVRPGQQPCRRPRFGDEDGFGGLGGGEYVEPIPRRIQSHRC